jgi:hypothetical protein
MTLPLSTRIFFVNRRSHRIAVRRDGGDFTARGRGAPCRTFLADNQMATERRYSTRPFKVKDNGTTRSMGAGMERAQEHLFHAGISVIVLPSVNRPPRGQPNDCLDDARRRP